MEPPADTLPQLYCRARPWFHIAVYDVESLEEVGTRYGLFFTIERITIQVGEGRHGLRKQHGVVCFRCARQHKGCCPVQSRRGLRVKLRVYVCGTAPFVG